MHSRRLRRIFYPVPAHQKPVCVDAVGRTGHKCAVVLPRHDAERVHLLGFHDQNLVDLIGQDLVQNAQQKRIADG